MFLDRELRSLIDRALRLLIDHSLRLLIDRLLRKLIDVVVLNIITPDFLLEKIIHSNDINKKAPPISEAFSKVYQ